MHKIVEKLHPRLDTDALELGMVIINYKSYRNVTSLQWAKHEETYYKEIGSFCSVFKAFKAKEKLTVSTEE